VRLLIHEIGELFTHGMSPKGSLNEESSFKEQRRWYD
jgi:hypothetical protein